MGPGGPRGLQIPLVGRKPPRVGRFPHTPPITPAECGRDPLLAVRTPLYRIAWIIAGCAVFLASGMKVAEAAPIEPADSVVVPVFVDSAGVQVPAGTRTVAVKDSLGVPGT